MTWIQTIIVAIVEGLTEFLPVSSTGHMIIAEYFLGIESTAFVKAFTVIIQFGAILSVVVLYWNQFFHVNSCKIFEKKGTTRKTSKERLSIYIKRFFYKYDFYWKLFVAFIPAAIFGVLFSSKIDELLESMRVVAIMLILGGILMLFVDNVFSKKSENQEITIKKALIIGLCQCIAMIPGVSRSMATIVGGMSQQLSRKNAAEFSFFLAVPTMFAASVYKLYKMCIDPEYQTVLMDNVTTLIVGNLIAFSVAIMAIKFFIDFVSKFGFKAFGYYRIVAGIVLLGIMFAS
jgi:undecaprenyl-diphosphatase